MKFLYIYCVIASLFLPVHAGDKFQTYDEFVLKWNSGNNAQSLIFSQCKENLKNDKNDLFSMLIVCQYYLDKMDRENLLLVATNIPEVIKNSKFDFLSDAEYVKDAKGNSISIRQGMIDELTALSDTLRAMNNEQIREEKALAEKRKNSDFEYDKVLRLLVTKGTVPFINQKK